MPKILPRAKRLAFALAGSAALVLGLATVSEPARAMPLVTAGTHSSIIEPARIYRRGRTPIYPYYYNPGRPGGYSFYFGFVPYAPGNKKTGAPARILSAESEWPPGLYGGPQPGWGPNAGSRFGSPQRLPLKNALSRIAALVSPMPPMTSGA